MGNCVGTQTTRFGPFELDAGLRRLSRGDEPLHLTPKAFDLLVLLLEEAPRVVEKRVLHERLWPGTFVSDATLSGLIKELRRVLGDRQSAAPIIRTVTRIGYAVSVDVDDPPSGRRARTHTQHWLVTGEARFPLRDGVNAIGRDPASDVWLDAASVSRRHARIIVDDEGARLEDLGSKNGTRVRNILVNGVHRLHDRDRMSIGTVPLTYRASAVGPTTETNSEPGDSRIDAGASAVPVQRRS
jgi:DNA-binding winged helix-turn-helix (wHTH) protein